MRRVPLFAALLILAACSDKAEPIYTVDELIAEQLLPEFLDRSDLGEETVTADIEAVALVLGRLGDASHRVTGFEDSDGHAAFGEQVRRRETGRPRSTDNNAVASVEPVNPARSRRRIVSFDQFHDGHVANGRESEACPLR